jgi:hypothetical protein
MSSPNYALRQAQESGRNSGFDYCRERAKYPLASKPKNPFTAMGFKDGYDGDADAWQSAFDEAVARWESESSLTKGKM